LGDRTSIRHSQETTRAQKSVREERKEIVNAKETVEHEKGKEE